MPGLTGTESDPLSDIVGSDLLPCVEAAARRSGPASEHGSDQREEGLDPVCLESSDRRYLRSSRVSHRTIFSTDYFFIIIFSWHDLQTVHKCNFFFIETCNICHHRLNFMRTTTVSAYENRYPRIGEG